MPSIRHTLDRKGVKRLKVKGWKRYTIKMLIKRKQEWLHSYQIKKITGAKEKYYI